MKRMLITFILLSAAIDLSAGNYNSISIQGQLNPPTPILNVSVWIRSGGSSGQVVGTASPVDLIPDADGIFSTHTYLSNSWLFQSGSDYVMQLSSSTGVVISTFPITAVPFALTVRGDAQTGNQNVFGAYGNIGIGTGTPAYRLEISSAAGSAEDIVVISTGGSPVIKMTGAGIIRANKYYGDGSSLTGITSAGDNLGNHTATQNLNLAKFDITNASTATFTGYINVTSNAGYEQGGGTILTSPGYSDLFLGYQAGYSDYTGSNYNTMVGFLAGNRDTFGYNNSFMGSQAGYSNVSGNDNSFVGYAAGYSNTSGSDNSYLGNSSGHHNTTGARNSFLGSSAGYYSDGYDDNTYLGYAAGYVNVNAARNTYVGSYAGYQSMYANNNSFLGYQAGYNANGGNNNIYIGYKAGYNNTSTSDSIILGYNQTSGGSSTLNIGGVLYGNLLAGTIGISRTTQGAALDVVSTGTLSHQFAQIWRNANDIVVGSMSATGVMKAAKFIGDGSGLIGIPSSADNLGNHTATQNIKLENYYLSGDGDNEGVSINAAGNVGVGTASPGAKLHVQDTDLSTNELFALTRGAIGGSDYTGLQRAPADAEGTNLFYRYRAADATAGPIVKIWNDITTDDQPTLWVRQDSSAPGLVVESGNVGIGTTSPETKLHIVGLNSGMKVQTTSPATWGPYTSLIGRSTGYMILEGDTASTLYPGSLANALVLSNDGAYPMQFNTTALPRMTILADGNVGIGATGPTAKLVVNGNIVSSGTIQASSMTTNSLTLGALKGTPSIFGEWINKIGGYSSQQAAADGFVMAQATIITPGTLHIQTDSSNPPTTQRCEHSESMGGYAVSCMSPVRKGDYWKVYADGGGVVSSVYWIPIGN